MPKSRGKHELQRKGLVLDVGFMRPLLVWRGYWIDGENVMSEFKGTPGPWAGKEVSICSQDKAGLCLGFLATSCEVRRAEGLANAHLICSSPELLEALQELVHADCHGVRNSSAQVRALNKAMLAIDKALGR
ncbi:TPA: hypothetical protein I9281_001259 [Serratia marcescens]|nr:hypothetical protein [Serratia marcescens]